MPANPLPPPDSGPASAFQPGQTVLFIGDHTSPDEPGYVGVISTVLERFHPRLKLNLISAGSRGQSAAGLRSPGMLEILTSSRPDWLVVGIGLADAAREPDAVRLLREHRDSAERADETLEATFGPEYRSDYQGSGGMSEARGSRASDSANDPRPPAFTLTRLASFSTNVDEALTHLSAAGVRPILMTTTLFDNDL